MKRTILAVVAAVALGAGGASSLRAQKPPAPKSQKELDAVKALFAASQAGPDQTIAAAEALITGFVDTEFKEIALFFEARSYQQKNDLVKAQVYGERVLEVNPKNYQTTLLLGEVIAQTTRENDLDKEEKLAKAEKYLKDTIENLKTATKPNPQTPDKDWEEARQQMTAEARSGMGLCALTRKKYDVAAAEFKAAWDLDPQPAFQVRQASALQSLGKNDEAIAVCDKVLADPQLHPQIKQVAQGIRASAIKAGGKAPDGK
jgi:tetratricopeptide (TPR) repeat protein